MINKTSKNSMQRQALRATAEPQRSTDINKVAGTANA